jgi:MerR family transcriptional regulator/heat shock protein HspR
MPERDGDKQRVGNADEMAVYVISVAAELSGMHPQTLRIYERKGLIRPARSAGNSRRYSAHDIARLRLIAELTQEGINLAGVKRIMDMQAENAALRTRISELETEIRRRAIAMPGRRVGADLVPLSSLIFPPWGERA